MFEIVQVALQKSQNPEFLGTKPKFWYRNENGQLILFKADSRYCGEDWSEKVACHLCKLLELPHVHYEMARYCDESGNQQPGVICESFTKDNLSWLFLGNSFLVEADPNYLQEKDKKYHVRQHTINAVSQVISSFEPPQTIYPSSPKALQSALDYFVGYVMLDAWIANQDRHHENWGAVYSVTPLNTENRGGLAIERLAPTFDHAASLARNLLDEKRKHLLDTSEGTRRLEAYTLKARSAFYENDSDTKAMLTFDAFWAFAEKAKPAARFWLKRLEAIDEAAIQKILDQVPESRMSAITKTFTLELLKINRKRLLEKAI